MSIPLEIREAPHVARGLRDAAGACASGQSVLKARLTAAASMLEHLAELATGTLDRVKALQAEAAAAVASRTALEEHVAAINSIPVEWLRPPGKAPQEPDAAIMVAGVDVADLAMAARLLESVEQVIDASDDPDAAELIAVIATARKHLQLIFEKLQVASRQGGAS
jgi:hypothetical protein